MEGSLQPLSSTERRTHVVEVVAESWALSAWRGLDKEQVVGDKSAET